MSGILTFTTGTLVITSAWAWLRFSPSSRPEALASASESSTPPTPVQQPLLTPYEGAVHALARSLAHERYVLLSNVPLRSAMREPYAPDASAQRAYRKCLDARLPFVLADTLSQHACCVLLPRQMDSEVRTALWRVARSVGVPVVDLPRAPQFDLVELRRQFSQARIELRSSAVSSNCRRCGAKRTAHLVPRGLHANRLAVRCSSNCGEPSRLLT